MIQNSPKRVRLLSLLLAIGLLAIARPDIFIAPPSAMQSCSPTTDPILIGPSIKSVVTGKFTGNDAYVDIAVMHHTVAGWGVTTLKNDGQGKFCPAQFVLLAGVGSPTSAIAGDFFTGVGTQGTDLAVADSTTGKVYLYQGNNNGDFILIRSSLFLGTSISSSPGALTTGQFDNNTSLDLAVAVDGTVEVLRNEDLSVLSTLGSGSPFAFSLTAGNFDNNGKDDIAVANSNTPTISVFYYPFTGAPVTDQTASLFPASSIAAGNFDADADLDLAVTRNTSSELNIYESVGVSINLIATLALPSPGSLVVTGDFNGDGKTDVAVANSTVSKISVFPGKGVVNGAIAFGARIDTAVETTPNSLSVGKFKGAGGPDSLALGNTPQDNVRVLHNGLQFYPLAHPIRLLDTRAGFGGCYTPGAKIGGGTSRTQPARGLCDGLSIPPEAQAITGNITTVESGGGFLTLYPSDTDRPLVANSNYQPNQILNNVFTTGLGNADGAFKIYVTSDTDVVVDVTGYYAPPGTGGLFFHPLPTPIRLLDTRPQQSGCNTPGQPLLATEEFLLQGSGNCGGVTIPATARALVGNATTVNPQANGFLTFFPADATRPTVSNGNYAVNQVLNSPFTVGLSPSGQFKIYTHRQTDLVVDVLGYYSSEASDANGFGLLFNPLPTPVRLLETRVNQSGCVLTGAPLNAGATLNLSALGSCVTVPTNARAIVGNATVVLPEGNGFLTFWPSGVPQPNVASSNYIAGQVFNRHFTVGLGAGIGNDGLFSIFSWKTTNLVIDVSGFFAP